MLKPGTLSKSLLVLTISSVSLSGCYQIYDLFGMNSGTGQSLEPNYTTSIQPAQIFYVDAPSTASANTEFLVTPWILLKPGTAGPLPKVGKLSLLVDDAARTITVSGIVNQFDKTSDKPAPTTLPSPSAATQSLSAKASTGSYTIVIPSDNFTSDLPSLAGPNNNPLEHPQPLATRSIFLTP